jgi:hypothetical protein
VSLQRSSSCSSGHDGDERTVLRTSGSDDKESTCGASGPEPDPTGQKAPWTSPRAAEYVGHRRSGAARIAQTGEASRTVRRGPVRERRTGPLVRIKGQAPLGAT